MILIALSVFSGDLVVNNLAFYELLPKFECQYVASPDVWQTCTQADFCPGFGKSEDELAVSFRANWDDEMSLRNWVPRLGMECATGAQFGLLGSQVFFGWTLSALFLPRLADLHGRKWVLLANQTA